MKNFLLSILALTSVLSFQSCSEDFDVAAPYKPVTVVYGMLNMKDTAHYVRIQKSFLDQEKNAFDMAKVSDSNFYKEGDLEVMIKEFAGGSLLGQPIMLTRVNMDEEGYPKDSGVFFRSPNYAYKFKKLLNPSRTYRLVITNKSTGITDSAEINIVDSAKLNVNGSNLSRLINFAETDIKKSGSTFALYLSTINTSWYYEGAIKFRWVEKNLITNVQKNDSAEFLFQSILGKDILNQNGSLRIENYKIHSFLVTAMGAAPDGVVRLMDSCDLIIYAWGTEYANYLSTLQIQASGLTSDQIKPVFTNITGKDVFGLFTSRASRTIRNAYIDDNTLKALHEGSATRALNIQTTRADP